MSDTKKKISPAKEDKPARTEEIDEPSTGVSPFGVVFLSLLTTIALLSAAFAFRDKVLPYLHQYLDIPKVEQQVVEIPPPPPGFVPVPAVAAVPSLEETELKFDEFRQQQAVLESKLAALQEQLANLPEPQPVQVPAPAEPSFAPEALDAALEKITELEAQLTNLQSLTAELAEAPREAAAAPVDIRGLVAFQTLQSKALSGQSFQEPLQRVVALLDDTKPVENALTKLEQVAQTGRPMLADLQDSFATVVSQYMQTEQAVDASFTDKLKQNLSSFVRVRRTDGEGNQDEVIIATAEKALMRGNVKTSYAELLKLQDPAKQVFTDWMQQARAYYQLPELLDQLQLQLANSVEAAQ